MRATVLTRTLVAATLLVGAALVPAAVAHAADPAADLAVTLARTPHTGEAGLTEITYTATVTNNGPDAATDVVLVDPLRNSPVEVRSATTTAGSCAVNQNFVTCRLGTMASAATATVTIKVLPYFSGALKNEVTVTSQVADPTPANDRAAAIVIMEPGPTYAERIVTGYFTDVLGRPPTATELDTWMARFGESNCCWSTVDGSPFARAILATNTYKLRLISEQSVRFTGAPSGPSMRKIYLQWLNTGRTSDHVIAQLAGSPAFYASAGGTASGFVPELVQELTGKAPSAAFRSELLGMLAAGKGRAAVAYRVVTDGTARSAHVRTVFERYIERPPSPIEQYYSVLDLLQNRQPERTVASVISGYEFTQKFAGPYCCEG